MCLPVLLLQCMFCDILRADMGKIRRNGFDTVDMLFVVAVVCLMSVKL
jgi:hypothetical protein